jgi:hypothetical protein
MVITTLVVPQELMSAAATEVTIRLTQGESETFSRQHLANTVWAYATLEVDPGWRLLSAMADAMCQRAADCNPQEISNTVWAMAKLRASFSYGAAQGPDDSLFL